MTYVRHHRNHDGISKELCLIYGLSHLRRNYVGTVSS